MPKYLDLDDDAAWNDLADSMAKSLLDHYNRTSIPAYDRAVIFAAMEFEAAKAYWITRLGKVRPVINTHIDDVIDSPVSFELTNAEIQEVYTKYNEALRVEGRARDDIIKNLCLKGWIRIRYYQTGNYYAIDVGNLNSKTREYLFEWAFKELEIVPNHKFSNVNISEFSSGATFEYDMNYIASGVLLSSFQKRAFVSDYLIPVHSGENFLSMEPVARMERNIKRILLSGE